MGGLRLIVGSGRSGTTWVQDALADANGLRPVFEPLHPWVSEVGARYAHRALSPDDPHPELRDFMADVCAGRRHLLWSRYRRQPSLMFPPLGELRDRQSIATLLRRWRKFMTEYRTLAASGRRREPLVKCIRAHLMLGWLSQQCGCRTVLIVRHPGAVIESELRSSWEATRVLEKFRSDEQLHAMTDGRYRALLQRALHPIEALAARWVIENQCALESADEAGVTVAYYENLKASPTSEWARMSRALGLATMPSPEALARPSQQSASKGDVQTVPSSVPRWARSLTKEQSRLVQGILDETGFELYNMQAFEPRRGGAGEPMGTAVGLAR